MKLHRLFIGICFFSVMVGCQTVPSPLEDYSFARAALEAARSVQAARHSPGYWHQAEEAYRKGRIYFEDRDFAKAKEALTPDAPQTVAAFDHAIALAEAMDDPAFAGVAEPQSRLKVEILAEAVDEIRAVILSAGTGTDVGIGFNAADGD